MKKILILGTSLLTMSQVSAMNKGELIDAMAKDAGLSKADSKRALEGVIAVATKSLKKNKSISIGSLGTLKVKEKANKTKCKSNKSCNIVVLDPTDTAIKFVYPVYVNRYWSTVGTIVAEKVEASINNPIYTENGNKGENPLYQGISPFFTTIGVMGKQLEDMVLNENPEEIFNVKLKRRYISKINESLSGALKEVYSATKLSDEDYKRIRTLLATAGSSLEKASNNGIDDDCDGIDDDCNLMGSNEIKKLTRKTKLKEDIVKKALSVANAEIAKALKRGEIVNLEGFGTFSISKRAARTGRNPQTGKEIKIAAKKVVKFKAGAELSKKVN